MNYYSEIKNKLIDNEVYSRVKDYSKERYKIKTYYEVGRLLAEAGKHYGEGIIKEYSLKLKNDVGNKYSVRLLYKIRRYYNFINEEKLPTVSAILTWSHYCELIWFNDINIINYYINITESQNLSVRQLRDRIKSIEYEWLPEETKKKIKRKEVSSVIDFVKNPIRIKNSNGNKTLSEKVLQRLILEDISSFLKELGTGFTFIDNEYKIKIGDTYNYIDLLLFNYEYNCFVVIELKVTKLKKEQIGQIQVYMNYIDNNLRKINQDKTIGIIICKEDNEYVIRYCSDNRIIAREYELV